MDTSEWGHKYGNSAIPLFRALVTLIICTREA